MFATVTFYPIWLFLVACLALTMPVFAGFALVGGVIIVASTRSAR